MSKSDAASSANQGSGRVRQKTISATVEELLGAESAAQSEQFESDPMEAQTSAANLNDAEEEAASDPLSAYLQELEDEQPVAVGAAPSEVKTSTGIDEDFEAFLQELDVVDEQEVRGDSGKGEFSPSKAKSPAVEAPDDFDALSPLMDEEVVAKPAPIVAPPPRAPERSAAPVAPRSQPAPAPVEKKVVSAPPPQQKQAQGNQPQGNQSQRGERQHFEARPQKEQRHPQQSGHAERKDNRHGGGQPAKQERRADDGKRNNQQHQGGGSQPRQHEAERDRPQVAAAGPKMGKMRPGRLFGWLVSFESPDGRAIELREGKFFVTGTSIRGTDLVIEDPSISTPHALMSVSAESGLFVQDLMSDRGIFIRSGERGQYRREDGPIEVRHGDWIRFGDVEFLITVVPVSK